MVMLFWLLCQCFLMNTAFFYEFKACPWTILLYVSILDIHNPPNNISYVVLTAVVLQFSPGTRGIKNLMRLFWKGALLNYSKCCAWIRSHMRQCWWSKRRGVHRVENQQPMRQIAWSMSNTLPAFWNGLVHVGFVKDMHVFHSIMLKHQGYFIAQSCPVHHHQ